MSPMSTTPFRLRPGDPYLSVRLSPPHLRGCLCLSKPRRGTVPRVPRRPTLDPVFSVHATRHRPLPFEPRGYRLLSSTTAASRFAYRIEVVPNAPTVPLWTCTTCYRPLR